MAELVATGQLTISRYYVLILACVLARKAEWIKNACLAAALLLPAVAAVHGIVLAALHRDGEFPLLMSLGDIIYSRNREANTSLPSRY